MTTLGPSTIRQIRKQHGRNCEPLQVRGRWMSERTCQPDKAFDHHCSDLRSLARSKDAIIYDRMQSDLLELEQHRAGRGWGQSTPRSVHRNRS